MAKKNTTQLSDDQFLFEGKSYRVLVHAAQFPFGVRTKLEIVADPEAQEFLVKNNCEGSLIEEVEQDIS